MPKISLEKKPKTKDFICSTACYSRFGDWRQGEKKLAMWDFGHARGKATTRNSRQKINLRAYFGYEDPKIWQSSKPKLQTLMQKKYGAPTSSAEYTLDDTYRIMCEQANKEINSKNYGIYSLLHRDTAILGLKLVQSGILNEFTLRKIAQERTMMERKNHEYEILYRGKIGLVDLIRRISCKLRLVVVVHDDGSYHEIMENIICAADKEFVEAITKNEYGPRAKDDLKTVKNTLVSGLIKSRPLIIE